MPKSVLRYELDKDSTSIWKLPLVSHYFLEWSSFQMVETIATAIT